MMSHPMLTRCARVATLLCLWACEPAALEGLVGEGGGAPAASRSDPSLVSLEAEVATHIYYQFVDDRGAVRFVPTLDQVPAAWRDRVGFVEMSSPPPTSPGEAQRLRQSRMARIRTRAPASRPSLASEPEPDSYGAGPEIILYSADWCPACQKAKRYMDERNIAYEERDVDLPEYAQELRAKSGGGSIPVFDIEGRILRGFSPQALDQLIDQTS